MTEKTGIQYDLIKIAQCYNDEYLFGLASEESAELIQAINKLLRFLNAGEYKGKEKELKEHLFEEIADVEILLQILKNRLKSETEVYSWKVKKVKRWKERLKEIIGELWQAR